MEILLGKSLVEDLKKEIKEKVNSFKNVPHYVILLNKEDSSSCGYAKSQMKLATSLGIHCEIRVIDGKNMTYEEEIQKINQDDSIDGVLITRPLFNEKNEEKIISLLDPLKDVDAIHPLLMGNLFSSKDILFPPATAEACLAMLKYYHVDLDGKTCLVIGRSISIGKPVSMLLLNENATVTMTHSHTKNLKELLKTQDIVIASLGKPLFIETSDMKKDAICLDCGIHYLEQGIVGDVRVNQEIQMISAVPGGIGPITSTLLLKHVVTLYEVHHHG